ncbi:MAG: hypothetical protein FGM15_09740 [Chthoniobacterales bacterium]|nr:hypothetical protein [Chthoniobacterales bacterium]
MSRQALLSVYDKLAALLEKLPGSLQEPVLRELEPIKEIFLRQRAPRVCVFGENAIELPALINALAGRAVLHAPILRGPWTPVQGSGTVDWADLRGSGSLSGGPADIYLLVATSSFSASDAHRTAEVLAAATPREGGGAAGLAVLTLGDAGDNARVLSALAETQASGAVLFSTHLPHSGLDHGFTTVSRSALGDRLCEYIPEESQLEMARFFSARGAQARLAGTVLKSFGAVAGIIGVQPIPLADFPILLTLQMFMVALIIHVSGREFSLRLAGEFAASLGVGFGAGLVFRETARAAVKILPVWGHMISGGVAGAGTYALGRAAIAYFIEGKRVLRLSHSRKLRKPLPSPGP